LAIEPWVDEDSPEPESMGIQHRQVSPEQWQRFEGYAAEMLTAFGMDLKTPGTQDTPRRYVQGLFDVTNGYEGDPKLVRVFPTECREGPDCRLSQVVEGPIAFFAMCEHHVMPFYGQAYVGYIAHEHIVGISKLSRLVRLFARRFTLQERIGRQIADALDEMLEPHGVAVYLEAQHLCMQMRGVNEHASLTRTTHWRGNYDGNPSLRSEFFTACGLER
jgi:GTP cyclohydrolase I